MASTSEGAASFSEAGCAISLAACATPDLEVTAVKVELRTRSSRIRPRSTAEFKTLADRLDCFCSAIRCESNVRGEWNSSDPRTFLPPSLPSESLSGSDCSEKTIGSTSTFPSDGGRLRGTRVTPSASGSSTESSSTSSAWVDCRGSQSNFPGRDRRQPGEQQRPETGTQCRSPPISTSHDFVLP